MVRATPNKVVSFGNMPVATTVETPVVTLAAGAAVNGIYFLDLSPTVAGVDTLYALSTVASQLLKYTFDGTTWTASGTLASTATNLSAATNGTQVSLYLTTPTALIRINDVSGYGGTLAGTAQTIATAATNTAFRGVGLLGGTFTALPIVPEPTTLVALAGLGFVGVARRRKA